MNTNIISHKNVQQFRIFSHPTLIGDAMSLNDMFLSSSLSLNFYVIPITNLTSSYLSLYISLPLPLPFSLSLSLSLCLSLSLWLSFFSFVIPSSFCYILCFHFSCQVRLGGFFRLARHQVSSDYRTYGKERECPGHISRTVLLYSVPLFGGY